LLPIAVAKSEAPRTYDSYFDKTTAYLPALYEAWVVKPAFVNDQGAPSLLGGADFVRGEMPSLLDTTILDRTAGEAVAWPAGSPATRRSPNLPKSFHLYMTLGILRGVPYAVEFEPKTEAPPHGLRAHADRAHVVFENAGAAEIAPSQFAAADTVDLTLDTAALPSDAILRLETFDEPIGPDPWGKFVAMVLGSAAFPGALRTRRIVPGRESYEGRAWPLDLNELHGPFGKDPSGGDIKTRIVPAWGSDTDTNLDELLGPVAALGRYEFRSVDGGVFNNEPFDLARYCLFDDLTKRRNDRDATTADRAVLMVDPFPEPPAVDPRDWKPEREWLAALTGLPGALVNQARFKPEDLVLAMDDRVFSRFLIAPVRRQQGCVAERAPLACGLLGGFGGFLDRALRDHDFVLGRRNCQNFLRRHFALAAGNGVFDGTEPDGEKAASAADAGFRPIIPLHGSARIDVALPSRPKVHVDVVRRMAEKAAERGEAAIDFTSRRMGGFFGWLVRQLGWMFGKSRIRTAVYQSFQADLIRRDALDTASDRRLAGLDGAGPRERLLLAAFCGSGESLETPEDIARAAGFPEDRLATARAEIDGIFGKFPQFVERDGRPGAYLYRTRVYWEAPRKGGVR
jgi:hypothetical protein